MLAQLQNGLRGKIALRNSQRISNLKTQNLVLIEYIDDGEGFSGEKLGVSAFITDAIIGDLVKYVENWDLFSDVIDLYRCLQYLWYIINFIIFKICVQGVAKHCFPPLHSKIGQYISINPYILGKYIWIEFCMQKIRHFALLVHFRPRCESKMVRYTSQNKFLSFCHGIENHA